MLREVAGESSLKTVMDSISNISTNFPSEPILCDYRMLGDISPLVFDARELGCVIINSSQRRIDLRWDIAGSDRTWCNLRALGGGVSKTVYEILSDGGSAPLWV